MIKDLYKKLLEIQRDLKCEKKQYNSFGKYSFRSKEDILEAVKPLAHEHGCVVTVDDEFTEVAVGWVYCKSTAVLVDTDTGDSVCCKGWAREPKEKKGMDESQITGTASSYAGKRALGNLFAIDDTADADKLNDHGKGETAQKKAPKSPHDWDEIKGLIERAKRCGMEQAEFDEMIVTTFNGKDKRTFGDDERNIITMWLKSYIADSGKEVK